MLWIMGIARRTVRNKLGNGRAAALVLIQIRSWLIIVWPMVMMLLPSLVPIELPLGKWIS